MWSMFSRSQIAFLVGVTFIFETFRLLQCIPMEWVAYKQNKLACHSSDVWKDHDPVAIITCISGLHRSSCSYSVGHIFCHSIESITAEEHEREKNSYFMSSIKDRKMRVCCSTIYFKLLSAMSSGPFSNLHLLQVLTLVSKTSLEAMSLTHRTEEYTLQIQTTVACFHMDSYILTVVIQSRNWERHP